MHPCTKEMNRYAWILTSFCLAKAKAWIERKEMGTGQWFKQKQLIPVQGVDSKKGQLIYLTRKGSFQVILYNMIRFLSGKLKKYTKLAKIVKISIFVNWLVFPMNFNWFTALFTKPSVGGWNDPQRLFQPPAPFMAYGSFRNCTRQNHGTALNREASSFVNSAVTALFTKPPYGLPPYRTTSGGRSCQWLPLTANGHFSVPQELYQAKPGTALPAALWIALLVIPWH